MTVLTVAAVLWLIYTDHLPLALTVALVASGVAFLYSAHEQ